MILEFHEEIRKPEMSENDERKSFGASTGGIPEKYDSVPWPQVLNEY
jgi:hypothetical protein